MKLILKAAILLHSLVSWLPSQGETLEEAERNIKEAAPLYLEDILAERGVLPRSGLHNC